MCGFADRCSGAQFRAPSPRDQGCDGHHPRPASPYPGSRSFTFGSLSSGSHGKAYA